MLELLAQYGLFLAKTLTLILAIGAVIALVAAIVAKAKNMEDELEVEKLNDKFKDIQDSLQSIMLDKKELKALHQKNKKHKPKHPHTLFVVHFEGDIKASEVKSLRETISAILTVATPKDEVVALIESPGGMVHSYGLAASQLDRIKQKNIPLTVIVDKIAASGGYMMACVGNKILSAPFAVIGSIGVVAQIPNFHRVLEKHDIDYEMHTAGEFKRTLTIFGKNTKEGREKFQEEIEETHTLFKQFVAAHRPALDIDKVATGEHWYGTDALALGLVDGISTSDDYLMSKLESHAIYEVRFKSKKHLSEKMFGFLQKARTELMGVI
jgi:serine protease SohB